MTPIELFETAGCRGCARVRALLARTGRRLRRRDLVAAPLTRDEIRHLAALAGGVRHLLSVRAPGYRAHRLDRTRIGEPALVTLIERDPDLLRRPIVVVDGTVLVGFDAELLEPARRGERQS